MGLNDQRAWFASAALWGFAEATAFFVVPDVLLTAAVLMLGIAATLRLAAAAAIAAVAGGMVMLAWGASDIDGAHAFLLAIPLIGGDLLARVQADIAGAWPANLTIGAITGAPYKIYAVEAGAAGINPFAFAFVSFAARLARFALVIGLFALGLRLLRLVGGARFGLAFLIVVWVGVYGVYGFFRINS
jgi:membrane protein YqaA with SNARE-associated domain